MACRYYLNKSRFVFVEREGFII